MSTKIARGTCFTGFFCTAPQIFYGFLRKILQAVQRSYLFITQLHSVAQVKEFSLLLRQPRIQPEHRIPGLVLYRGASIGEALRHRRLPAVRGGAHKIHRLVVGDARQPGSQRRARRVIAGIGDIGGKEGLLHHILGIFPIEQNRVGVFVHAIIIDFKHCLEVRLQQLRHIRPPRPRAGAPPGRQRSRPFRSARHSCRPPRSCRRPAPGCGRSGGWWRAGGR